MLNVKSLRVPGANSHVIVRQLSNRVRFELEGAGLPRGKYTLALGDCGSHSALSPESYKRSWKEVHHFTTDTTHVATEQSLQKAKLRGPGSIEGQGLALFHVTSGRYAVVDCQDIK
jgi:hypothetical protein